MSLSKEGTLGKHPFIPILRTWCHRKTLIINFREQKQERKFQNQVRKLELITVIYWQYFI